MAIDFPDTRINNPETGLPWVNGDTFTDIPTGLTYYWFDPVWKREISVTGATDEKYVERAGDNMTGNLTLGDGINDKITLDNSGSANFAGGVTISSDGDVGTYIGQGTGGASNPGLFITKRDVDGTGDVCYIQGNAGSAIFKGDGSATFAGSIRGASWDASGGTGTGYFLGSSGNVRVRRASSASNDATLFAGYKGDGNPVAEIMADGSATFANTLSVTGGGISCQYGPIELYAGNPFGKKVSLNTDGSASFGNDVTINRNFSNETALEIKRDGTTVIDLRSNGGATYTGQVAAPSIYTPFVNQRAALGDGRGQWEVYHQIDRSSGGSGSWMDARWYIASTSNNNYARTMVGLSLKYNYDIPASPQFTFHSSGNFTCSTVNGNAIYIALEPENDAAYTVTGTEEYEEFTDEIITPYIPFTPATYDEDGNELTPEVPETEAVYASVTKTREIRTYTGPTLDVKERLTKADTALQTLKTAAAAAADFAELKAAIATALADI